MKILMLYTMAAVLLLADAGCASGTSSPNGSAGEDNGNTNVMEVVGAETALPADPAPSYGATKENAGDTVSVSLEGSDAVVEVTSPRGIGSAQVVLPEEGWQAVVLRLHLAGLEDLRFGYGPTEVRVSVSSLPGGEVSQRVTRGDGPEVPVQPGSPFWLDLSIEGDSQQIPLKDGVFVLRVPDDFLQQRLSAFTLSWIDFYR